MKCESLSRTVTGYRKWSRNKITKKYIISLFIHHLV